MIGICILAALTCIVVLLLGIAWYGSATETDNKGYVALPIVVTVIVIAAIIAGTAWYLNRTEPGQRIKKSWQSEIGEGLNRTVTIYDVEGDVIKEYSGRFDVDHDSSRIIFDDDQGKRHMIYYTTGTVIIDEN
jgi:hypothetical protein